MSDEHLVHTCYYYLFSFIVVEINTFDINLKHVSESVKITSKILGKNTDINTYTCLIITIK